jgi:hypothetical protein
MNRPFCAVASVINFAIRGRRPEADRIDPDIDEA